MTWRILIAFVALGATLSAQQPIEPRVRARTTRGSIAQQLSREDGRGVILPVVGRRTTVTRITNEQEVSKRGFVPQELAALGIFTGAAATANAVIGTARDSASNLLPDVVVQLRELRTGVVVGRAHTSNAGQFAFPGLQPGTYVVELVTTEGTIVALSDALSIGTGELVSTVVQVPAPTRSFVGWVGGATANAAQSAATAGVLALEPAQAVSPES